MSNDVLVFAEVLRHELDALVAAPPGAEVALGTAALAARLLRRTLVEQLEVPALRETARASYRALLPQLESMLEPGQVNRFVGALDQPDQVVMEHALVDVLTMLLTSTRVDAERLAGALLTVDADLRERKEKACQRREEPPPSRSTSSEPVTGTPEQQAALLSWLLERYPAETDLKITKITQIPGGFSKHTLFIDLANTVDLPGCLVMRRDGPFPGSSVVTEYPIIERLHRAGVRVPRPYAMDETGEIYGKPFILVSRAPGRVIGDFVEVKEPSREVALDLAAQLARLHAAPFDGLEDALFGGHTSVTERLATEIEDCRHQWGRVVHVRSHVVDAALDWLQSHVELGDGPRAVIHRDIGAHNMLVDDGRVTAFLDWETPAVGTPCEDVAYVRDTVAQMMDWPDFLAAYQEQAAITLDPRSLDFYQVWASVRILVPIARNTDPVFSGRRKNLPEYFLGDQIVQVLIQRLACTLARILTTS